ncbi:MAG: pyruvate kinase [Bacillota bacterium]|nr:pyruvate kinase [Bacillota bacterium]MDW7684152.1 pyruvate kinase [Bacillota bacterium]
MRRTKIVCTLGPASSSVPILKSLISAGMNVARLNFSHGTHAEHAKTIAAVRQADREQKGNLALLLDTKGPEIRIGTFADGAVKLQEGQDFALTTEQVAGDGHRVSVNYPGIIGDVKPGMKILLDDGLIILEVVGMTATDVQCRVLTGGELSNRKGVNIPGAKLALPAISEKDREDIIFAVRNDLDFIAASFVRKADDVLAIRAILEEHHSRIQIIAKIENQEGVENIDKILAAADGIMVARGDLGVEIPAEDVPLAQKMIISKCNVAGKPVITATQMLDSMIRNPRPTRAEASDVANAIFDGTDAVMLSGETAVGKYPLETVQTMARIAERAETGLHYAKILESFDPPKERSVTDAIAFATCHAAQELGAAAIITATQSGSTARNVSKYKPKARIIAVTPRRQVARFLALTWGVCPVLCRPAENTDEMFSAAIEASVKSGYVSNGDLVLITAGVPVGVSGSTNLLRVHTVGEILLQGTGLGKKPVSGEVRVARTGMEAAQLKRGEILVTPATDSTFIPYLENAAGLVVEEGGLTSHAAVVALHMGLPVIVGVEGALARLSNGELITLDTVRGLIYRGRATIF